MKVCLRCFGDQFSSYADARRHCKTSGQPTFEDDKITNAQQSRLKFVRFMGCVGMKAPPTLFNPGPGTWQEKR